MTNAGCVCDRIGLLSSIFQCKPILSYRFTFQLNYEPSNQLKELKERLTILQGSIQAGNDNNLFIYEEAIEVVNALVKHNANSESDGTEIIDELKESQKS